MNESAQGLATDQTDGDLELQEIKKLDDDMVGKVSSEKKAEESSKANSSSSNLSDDDDDDSDSSDSFFNSSSDDEADNEARTVENGQTLSQE